MKQQRQQGDVLFERVNSIPKKAKRRNKVNGRWIIAEGEHTGHTHATVDDIELFETNGVLYIKNAEPATITHEEHGPVEIPAGVWKTDIVKEMDYFDLHERRVQD